MSLILDSFWRAALYCLHPRVMLLSLLPLAIMVALSFAAGYWYWEPAVAAVTAWLESNALLAVALGWLDSVGLGALRSVLGPLVVLFMATPLIVITALLLVGLMMTPSMVTLVAQRRFPALERRRGASWVTGLFWSLASTLMALSGHGGIAAFVADSSADHGAAAPHLGLADIPRVCIRRAGRPCQC
jgi:hypothetical protein